jgi:hypothetical protein
MIKVTAPLRSMRMKASGAKGATADSARPDARQGKAEQQSAADSDADLEKFAARGGGVASIKRCNHDLLTQLPLLA